MRFDPSAENASQDVRIAVNILQPGMTGDFRVVAFV
jgi:hypothetical protein